MCDSPSPSMRNSLYEVLPIVFKHLNLKTLLQCRLVSKKFKTICDNVRVDQVVVNDKPDLKGSWSYSNKFIDYRDAIPFDTFLPFNKLFKMENTLKRFHVNRTFLVINFEKLNYFKQLVQLEIQCNIVTNEQHHQNWTLSLSRLEIFKLYSDKVDERHVFMLNTPKLRAITCFSLAQINVLFPEEVRYLKMDFYDCKSELFVNLKYLHCVELVTLNRNVLQIFKNLKELNCYDTNVAHLQVDNAGIVEYQEKIKDLMYYVVKQRAVLRRTSLKIYLQGVLVENANELYKFDLNPYDPTKYAKNSKCLSPDLSFVDYVNYSKLAKLMKKVPRGYTRKFFKIKKVETTSIVVDQDDFIKFISGLFFLEHLHLRHSMVDQYFYDNLYKFTPDLRVLEMDEAEKLYFDYNFIFDLKYLTSFTTHHDFNFFFKFALKAFTNVDDLPHLSYFKFVKLGNFVEIKKQGGNYILNYYKPEEETDDTDVKQLLYSQKAHQINGLYKFYNFFQNASSNNANEVNRHLQKGMELLARGQFSDALSHYHAAIDGDPKNYLTYFKRATVYLAIGKPKAALDDLNEVLELNDDFAPARSQRGSLLLKMGRIDEAHIDLEHVLRAEPHNQEAINQYNLIEHIKLDYQNLELILQERAWAEAIDLLSKLIQELPYNSKLRELRAECFQHLGNKQNAIADLTVSTKMNNDDTNGLLKLSRLHYEIGEVEESLKKIRECLKMNPDHKECMAHYRKAKPLFGHVKAMNDHSQAEEYTECIERADKAIKLESKVHSIVQQLWAKKCHCANKGLEPADAIAMCTEALKYDQNDVNVLCDRAEAYLNEDDFESAEADFHKAANLDPHLTRAQEGVKKAQNVAKQRSKKDYYKILEIKRTASKRDIQRQYRKMAAKWHPDNFTDEKEKAKAEKVFVDIARAKEVLTDDEKRKMFDSGIDPLDSEAQQQHQHGFHGFPFQGGFGDSPFVFRFNFN